MSDIFISYARVDRGKTQALAAILERQSWTVWWDRNIPPGKSFDAVIESELDAAKSVIVLWSRVSVSSEWTKTEAAEGARRGILVPAVIEDVKIPLEFRRIQAANLCGWDEVSPHPGLDELLQALSALLRGTGLVRLTNIARASEQPSVQGQKTWRAELVSSSTKRHNEQRTIRVYLPNGAHIIEWTDTSGLLGKMTIKVDGALVWQKLNIAFEFVAEPAGEINKFDFELRDGTVSYSATIEMRYSSWIGTVEKFRLIVDRRILYSED